MRGEGGGMALDIQGFTPAIPYLCCWLFASNNNTCNQLDDIFKTTKGYDEFSIGFYGCRYKPYLASFRPDRIFEKSLHMMKWVQDYQGK